METHEVIYGSSVGIKFGKDGAPLHFPGNTIISLLEQDSPIYQLVNETQDLLLSQINEHLMTALPKWSFHMTAIEGVCDKVRDKEHWTSLLSLDTPLEKVNSLFSSLWEKAQKMPDISMKVINLRLDEGCSLRLEPLSDEDEYKIRKWRDSVGDLFGLHFPNHETYGFHIGIAYNIIKPNKEERVQIESVVTQINRILEERSLTFQPPQPQLVFFDDMFSFGKQ